MSFITTQNNLSETQNKIESILDDSKFSNKYNDFKADKPSYTFKVILLGDVSVGKTSILNRFMEKKYEEDYQCTINISSQKKTLILFNLVVELNIWDTCGEERFKSLSRQFYKNANGIVLNYDINNRKSFESLNNWLNDIKEYANKNVSIIIVGNKNDLERNVSKEELINFCEKYDFPFVEVSAKNAVNIDLIFEKLSKNMIDNFKLFEEEENNRNNIDESSITQNNNEESKNNMTLSQTKIKLSNSIHDDSNMYLKKKKNEKKRGKEVSCC